MPEIPKSFKWFLRFILAVPFIFAVIRGFTLALGQGSEAFGMVMTDKFSLIVFWLLVLLVAVYCIVYVGTAIQNRLTKKNALKGNSKFKKEVTLKLVQGDSADIIMSLALFALIVFILSHHKKKGKV